MLHQLSIIGLPAAFALVAAVGTGVSQSPTPRQSGATIAPASRSADGYGRLELPQARATRWVLAATGNEARYRVREQLAGFDLPNDAVGKTTQVTGAIIIGTDGRIVREGSSFTVDLASIKSDNDRRDGYVRRNTLKTDSFPTAVFVPTAATGLPAPLPATGEIAFQLVGDLTIHGVTKPATWQVKATRAASGAVSGTATTDFKFGDYNMALPRAARVLSVDDKITLEYDFTLEPQPVSKQ